MKQCKGLCVVWFLHQVLINAVTCNKSHFILPVLPETSYSLDEVIILPQNNDFVETKLLTTVKETLLARINVTLDNGFRLGNSSAIQNASVESGLQIETTSMASVVIQLKTGLLHLPSVQDYANEYHILPSEKMEILLFIQPRSPNTSITICLHNFDKNGIYSHKNSTLNNCSVKNISNSEKILPINVSMLYGIEIISDQPVSILEGRRTHLSSLVRNGQDFNTSKQPAEPISWRMIPPDQDWSNQYFLIPSEYRREVKLCIMSFKNTTVSVTTEGGMNPLSLLANEQGNISVSLEQGTSLLVSADNEISILCQDSHASDCNQDIMSINAVGRNDIGSLVVQNESINHNNYKWIYNLDDTILIIICPIFEDADVFSFNGSTECAKEFAFNISSQYFKVSYYNIISNSLYKIKVNTSYTVTMCNLFTSSERHSPLEEDLIKNKRRISTLNSTSFNHSDMSINVSTVSENTFLPQNVSASSSLYENDANSTKTEMVFSKTTSEKMPNENRNKADNKTKGNSLNKDPNYRFKAVVDILQTKNGTVNTLIFKDKKPKTKDHPTYIYKVNVDEEYAADDGKNPIAVIVSLVSAFLAVGGIILIFLLKEIFSRRQQLRNTRIRPFISYY